MDFFKKNDPDRARYWPFWVIMLVLSIVMTFTNIASDAPWYDESYSIATAAHPMGEMISLIATDSHPPLYYVLLRAVNVIFGNSLIAMRGLSAISIVGTIILAYAFLRRRWGSPGALAFSFLFLVTPMAIGAAQEARMYTLALFFVTGMVLTGADAVAENRPRDWVALSIFAAAAAWTHYFALIAAGLYWLILCARTATARDETGKGKFAIASPFMRTLIAGGAVLVLYLPWLFNLLNQAARVSKNYWIGPIDGRAMMSILCFPFGQRFGGPHATTSFMLFLICHAVSVIGIIRSLRKDPKAAFLPLSAYLVYWLTFATGVFLSWTIRPIFVERYLVTCMGALMIAFASAVHGMGKKRFMVMTCAVYLFATAPVLKSTYTMRVNGAGDLVYMTYKDRVKEGDVFVHGSEHTFGILRYYFPNNRHYLYLPKDFIPFGNHAVFKPNAETGHDLLKYANEPVTIWAVGRTGEYYSTPWAELTGAPHRVPAGSMQRHRKEPGWLTILMQEITYDKDKTEAGAAGSGYLTVKVTGIDPGLGGEIVYALYASDPIQPGNYINSGSVAPSGSSVSITFDNTAYGEYALVAFHDLNKNYMPDFKANAPTEGLAMGVNPANLAGDPTFDELKFKFSDKEPLAEIKMFYPVK